MSKLEQLVRKFETFCALPWKKSIAGSERIWFIIYDPADERRLRARIAEFDVATKKAKHGWRLLDLTDAFGRWVAGQEYRDSYFECFEDLEPVIPQFEQHLVRLVNEELNKADETSVVAISGIGTLFGVTSVSSLIEKVAPQVRGRLAVFFPGTHDNNNYRLLDAKDGWNYLAVPLTAYEAGETP